METRAQVQIVTLAPICPGHGLLHFAIWTQSDGQNQMNTFLKWCFLYYFTHSCLICRSGHSMLKKQKTCAPLTQKVCPCTFVIILKPSFQYCHKQRGCTPVICYTMGCPGHWWCKGDVLGASQKVELNSTFPISTGDMVGNSATLPKNVLKSFTCYVMPLRRRECTLICYTIVRRG